MRQCLSRVRMSPLHTSYEAAAEPVGLHQGLCSVSATILEKGRPTLFVSG